MKPGVLVGVVAVDGHEPGLHLVEVLQEVRYEKAHRYQGDGARRGQKGGPPHVRLAMVPHRPHKVNQRTHLPIVKMISEERFD